MRLHLIPLVIAILIVGCIEPRSGDKEGGVYIGPPTWIEGEYWVYTFSTPDIQDVVSRLVVAGDDGTNYLVGVASLYDAQLHAVLNFNPVLGRVTMDTFSLYEKGIPQPIFSFPLSVGKRWTFSLMDVESFQATVTEVRKVSIPDYGKTTLAYISALGSNGARLEYVYDSEAKWIRSMTFVDDREETQLVMTLVSHGYGFLGRVYFIRARDLFDGEYTSTATSPVVEVYDSFVNQGHPTYGPFDSLVYFLNIDTGSDATGSIALKDHTSRTAFQRLIGPDTEENTLGSIPSESGNWTVSVTLSGDAYLRIRVAGGIKYVWDASPVEE